MKRKMFVLATFLMIVATLSIIIIPAIEARTLTVTDEGSFTEYVGALGGANFVVCIPDNWNGMLIVGCHGYSYPTWNPDFQSCEWTVPFST